LKAAVLAGGAGIRLRPLTYLYPKVMMPLGGKPLLEYTIDYLKSYGFDEVVLCVAYLRNRIREYFQDGRDFGVRISYAEADQPLGTAGQLATARKLLTETFLAMNGDILTSMNLQNMMEAHRKSGNTATISLKTFNAEVPYGCVELDNAMNLTSFREKPTLTYLANAGLYALNPSIFDHIKMSPVPVDLEREVFPEMIAAGEKVAGYREDAYWSHIGTVADLEKTDKEMSARNNQETVQLQPLPGNPQRANHKSSHLALSELMTQALQHSPKE